MEQPWSSREWLPKTNTLTLMHRPAPTVRQSPRSPRAAASWSGGFGSRFGAEKSADRGDEKGRGQSTHQDARQPLQRTEQPPLSRENQIAVTDGRIRGAGEIERGLRIRQALPPPIEECPDGNLGEMQEDQPPRDLQDLPGHGQ